MNNTTDPTCGSGSVYLPREREITAGVQVKQKYRTPKNFSKNMVQAFG